MTSYLPGKDAPLESTIAAAHQALANAGLDIREVSWRNPTPNCWSVHLEASGCPYLFANGKGRSRDAALASGLAEFVERLATKFFFTDYFLDEKRPPNAPLFFADEQWYPVEQQDCGKRKHHALLSPALWQLYGGHTELDCHLLREHNSADPQRGIAALPFRCMRTGEHVLFPVSLLNNLYLSNGMAAGNSEPEATAQALGEILERYVKNIVIAKGYSLPDIPAQRLAHNPIATSIITSLTEAGYLVRIKDCSLGGRFPVVCALLLDGASGGGYAAFGANCRFDIAVERTLTELLQGRSLDTLHSFAAPSHDLAEVADPCNLESHFIDSDGILAWRMFREIADFPYHQWNVSGTTREECDYLLAIIENNGFQAFRAEYCQHNFYSCRIIVPGMSEIYPIDDLVYNNKILGAELRPLLLRMPAMDDSELDTLLDHIERLGLPEHQLVGELIGVIFAEGSAWHSLNLGELKTLIHLGLGNEQISFDWCRWCAESGQLPERRRRLYRLLSILLGFQMEGDNWRNYRTSLNHSYSADELDTGRRILNGSCRFYGLSFAARWADISTEHHKLLNFYHTLPR